MIKEMIAKKIFDSTINTIIQMAENEKKKIKTSLLQIEEAMYHHINMVGAWSNEISFKGIGIPKETSITYLPLNFFLTPLKVNQKEMKEPTRTDLNYIIKSSRNIVILGQPGAGKSTTMKHICQNVIEQNKGFEEYTLPILVKFRDFNSKMLESDTLNCICNFILSELNIIIENNEKSDSGDLMSFKRKVVINILNDFNALLILDGFDELPSTLSKDKILKELNDLSLRLSTSKFIMTCRTGDYDFNIENCRFYEISPMSKAQIREFVQNWLQDENAVRSLYEQLLLMPYFDTTIRPLTLAHLCAIYEREGEIPDKPYEIYEKIVQLLLSEWNIENRIIRPSKFTNFQVKKKELFLSNLAFELTTTCETRSFDNTDLYKCYIYLHKKFKLPLEEQKQVINEIETHNGLIIQTSERRYEFAHLSLQEYFTAKHLVGTIMPTSSKLILALPNEFAITVSISTESTKYFCHFIRDCLINIDITNYSKIREYSHFLKRFISRLILEKPDFMISSQLGSLIIDLYNTYAFIDKDLNALLNELVRSEQIKNSVTLLSEKYANRYSTTKHVFKKNALFYTYTNPIQDVSQEYVLPPEVTIFHEFIK